ncbi:methyltransferase domain-containing protein [Acidaminobacter sp. JC074]|uniref:class I SAM-dependent methyltransferase n=1 Tax=Acidaminobacter sp. JC074 TaxID=2530199 RepID=UPI001F0D57E2|nr:class I SAM-dependent methyltransferase [Acidaminobacter sp. JC074]MCH4886252.1 methyltransferase domain-containing protein [Acidaminobacter sp. JC074]
MNQSESTRDFYNKYGEKEWERLFRSPQDKLNYILHMDFLDAELGAGITVLDAGCGGGRFSVDFAKRGCHITLLDISDEQIRIAEEKLNEYDLGSYVDKALVGDIGNLDMIEDDTFDVTVCYGAPLSYLYDNYLDGIKELYRVTKPGGQVFISVNNRLGVIRTLIGRNGFDIVDFLARKDYWFVDEVVQTGNLPSHPDVAHPPRHFFEASELMNLFKEIGFKDIKLGSSPCLSAGLSDRVEEIYENKDAWETLVDLEIKSYQKEATLDLGEFLMIKGRK